MFNLFNFNRKSSKVSVEPTKVVSQPEVPPPAEVEATPKVASQPKKILTFFEEMENEIESILIESAQKAEDIKDIQDYEAEKVSGFKKGTDKIKETEKLYYQAQMELDQINKKLNDVTETAQENIREAAKEYADAEAKARAKIAEMRAARNAGISYSEYIRRKEAADMQANAKAIADAKAKAKEEKERQAEARKEFLAKLPRI